MTLDEIYADISAHMIKGLMVHEQFADYYDFLGLSGYRRCHEYHFFEESRAFRELSCYYINHHNKLIPYKPVEDPKVIPFNWYGHARDDVDSSTIKNAIKTGLIKWVSWEKETKILYERMYKELMDIGEVASAIKIKELICDVDSELKEAEQFYLNKEAIGYDLVSIVEEQKPCHKKYKSKLRKCFNGKGNKV